MFKFKGPCIGKFPFEAGLEAGILSLHTAIADLLIRPKIANQGRKTKQIFKR